MRLLDTDVDLILLALTVLLTVGTLEPPTQPPADVSTLCVESACYQVPPALP